MKGSANQIKNKTGSIVNRQRQENHTFTHTEGKISKQDQSLLKPLGHTQQTKPKNPEVEERTDINSKGIDNV